MSEHGIHVVLAVFVSPVEELLHCIVIILVGVLRETSIVRSTVTDVRVVIVCTVVGSLTHVAAYGYAEVIGQVHGSVSRAVDDITAALVLVSTELVCDVTVAEIVRCRVVLLVTVGVELVAAVSVVHEKRIDRSHHTGHIEWVGEV